METATDLNKEVQIQTKLSHILICCGFTSMMLVHTFAMDERSCWSVCFLQNIFNTELWIMFKITLPPEMCLSKYDLDIKVLWCCIPILYLDVIWSKICARALSKAKPWIIMVSVSATYWHLSCLSKYESMFGSRLVASESFLLSDFPYALLGIFRGLLSFQKRSDVGSLALNWGRQVACFQSHLLLVLAGTYCFMNTKVFQLQLWFSADIHILHSHPKLWKRK